MAFLVTHSYPNTWQLVWPYMLTNWLYPKEKINFSYFCDKGFVSWSQAPVKFMVLPPHKNWEIRNQGAISLDFLSRRWLPGLWERHLRFKNWQNIFSFLKNLYISQRVREINDNFLKKNAPRKRQGKKDLFIYIRENSP